MDCLHTVAILRAASIIEELAVWKFVLNCQIVTALLEEITANYGCSTEMLHTDDFDVVTENQNIFVLGIVSDLVSSKGRLSVDDVVILLFERIAVQGVINIVQNLVR